MLCSVDFIAHRPLTETDLKRSKEWRGIHTETIPGSDHAIRNKANDYLIDRAAQKCGASMTGMKGLGTQDCAIQESMGPIADRTREYLLVTDTAIVKIRRLLLKALDDHAAGKPLPGLKPESFRVRSTRFEAPKGTKVADSMLQRVRAAAAG
jgi:phthalate 4,5-dioxygenase oxygenase subunit